MVEGVMNPCSCIKRMPLSLVAPQTPAWVVTGRLKSRATSNAAFSGKAGSPVTSKACCMRIDCRIGVFDRLQAMRPVYRRGDSGVYGLDRSQEIPGINILGTEDLA